jgi:hypothetical protein
VVHDAPTSRTTSKAPPLQARLTEVGLDELHALETEARGCGGAQHEAMPQRDRRPPPMRSALARYTSTIWPVPHPTSAMRAFPAMAAVEEPCEGIALCARRAGSAGSRAADSPGTARFRRSGAPVSVTSSAGKRRLGTQHL